MASEAERRIGTPWSVGSEGHRPVARGWQARRREGMRHDWRPPATNSHVDRNLERSHRGAPDRGWDMGRTWTLAGVVVPRAVPPPRAASERPAMAGRGRHIPTARTTRIPGARACGSGQCWAQPRRRPRGKRPKGQSRPARRRPKLSLPPARRSRRPRVRQPGRAIGQQLCIPSRRLGSIRNATSGCPWDRSECPDARSKASRCPSSPSAFRPPPLSSRPWCRL